MPNDFRHDETQFYDRNTATTVAVRIPPSSSSSCIRTPPWLAVLTVVGILLVVTDIPRTGSSSIIRDVRHKVGPGARTFWGPYDYHVGHLQLEHGSSTSARGEAFIDGTRNGEKLEYLTVWSYKEDTLSIAQRAIVGHLNVTLYPACILYREPCRSAKLDLLLGYTMLDDLIQSVETRLFADTTLEAHPFSFATWSNWVDRVHHRVYLAFGRNADMRSHDLYHLSSRNKSANTRHIDPLYLCGHRTSRHGQPQYLSSQARPVFCDDAIKWRYNHPTNRSQPPVSLEKHIAIRYGDLQRRYPNVGLDFTMFITTLKEKTHSNKHILPSIGFVTDALEITTLIRGRQCHVEGNCRTVFVDDFRYERAIIESDEEEWSFYVSGLRWASQIYVWTRVCCLFVGCYFAREEEPSGDRDTVRSKLIQTGSLVLKIPGHVIVYGSWIPLIGHSLAHFCDSSLVQTVGEFAWSSVGGFYAFHPVEYVVTACIQMRNIWMIALLWKITSRANVILRKFRPMSRHHGSEGVLCFRGGWIGFISWLTTFGLMRALRFRDTNVMQFIELPRHTPTSVVHVERNFSDYGVQFDVKCTFTTIGIIFSIGYLVQKMLCLATGQKTSIFFSRSFYVPYSAGTLWSLSQLDTFWLVRFRGEGHTARVYADLNRTFVRLMAQRKSGHIASASPSVLPASHSPSLKLKSCRVCGFEPSLIHWRATQGCLRHEPILDVHRRTKALWSMVRLMNIASMTEPVVLFRLYVTGRPLYLYRVICGDEQPYSVLLPTRLKPHDDTATAQTAISRLPSGGLTDSTRGVKFELQQIVDSRDVPWHVLVNCG